MGKLSRPTSVSVFASQALTSEMTVFGDDIESKDINLVLNGVDAERGWGVVGASGLPPMEWFNALGYSLSYYSSYLMQAGIAEWVTTQNYYINSRCVGSDGKEYVSLSGVDGTPNAGNNPTTDTVNWSESYKKFIPLAINAATAKTTPVDADLIGIADSAASFVLKKLTWANVKATILSAFGVMISTATAKTTPVDADIFIIGDSAASNASKKLTWANIKTALTSLFAPVNSPAFTGNPTAPTPSVGDNDTSIATTAFVNSEISNDVGVANSALVKTALNATGPAPIFACRAWVSFDGSTMGIYAAQNISSITDNAVGDYTLNFTVAMPDAGYAFPAGIGRTDTIATALQARVVNASYLQFHVRAGSNNVQVDSPYVTVSIIR